MKKAVICLLFSLIIMAGLFADDYSVFHGEMGRRHDLNDLSNSYNYSINDFVSIFSSNALKILMGEIDILSSRWVQLDIFSLSQLDNRSLRLLRNMIYARHGYRLSSPDLTDFFGRFSWYNPRSNNVDNLLTDVDKFHIQMIQAFENRNENLPNVVLNNPVGFWHDSPAVAAGYGKIILIHPNNRMEFHFSSMQNMPIASSLNGSYVIRGNVLIYTVTEIGIIMNNADIVYEPWGYNWESSTGNKLTLEKPIIYRFPVSAIETRSWGSDLSRETITIGGRSFYKLSDNVNHGRN